MQVVQAFDGALIADIPVDDAASIEAKLSRAAMLFRDRNAWLPKHQRIAILRRLAALVQTEADDFALLIAREGGKPLADAQVEVTRAVNGILGAISVMETAAGKEVPMGLTPASEGRFAFTTLEPIGVVIAISAFNHPLNLIIHQVVPAIATGCPVIVKPANPTPLCCLRFVELAHQAGLPEDWCQTVIVEDLSLAESLATDPRVSFLSFIGSARVGWHLRSKIAPGTRIALEHGGAAPLLVDRSCTLDDVLTPIAKGAFYHAGQVCVSTQRIYVHHELKVEFVERFTEIVRKLRTGDPTDIKTEVGSLIHPKEVTRVESWVNEARAEGATITTGGHRINDHLYQPTLIVDPAETSRVSREEIFGPVACVYGFTDLADAITRANSLPYAFQAAIFTRDIDNAFQAAKALDASTVMINDHTAFRTDWMPFAGRRRSGLGIGGIPFTMQDMQQEKMIGVKFH
jgi:acyl-CoA reductase-like NAD-dependent aldehyde dehydrogenase